MSGVSGAQKLIPSVFMLKAGAGSAGLRKTARWIEDKNPIEFILPMVLPAPSAMPSFIANTVMRVGWLPKKTILREMSSRDTVCWLIAVKSSDCSVSIIQGADRCIGKISSPEVNVTPMVKVESPIVESTKKIAIASWLRMLMYRESELSM